MKAKLPHFFNFKSANDLIRLGRDNDGGYLVSEIDIKKSNILISLGIDDDWSFEEHFSKINDIPVYAYDASVNLKFWAKRALTQTIINPFSFYIFKKIFSYIIFFRNNKKHIKKFVGLNTNFKNYCTLSSILKSLNFKNVFLKIDIEGAEYRVLDTLIYNSEKISGLVIEFHDCDIHLDKIKKFISKFDLKLVHIHANNFAPIRSNDMLPIVLELTFSKYSDLKDEHYLPHSLDMPNDKKKLDIILSIDNFS